ncbi:hypothetical protein ACLMJK_005806 [Lecanora helva]
MEIAGVVLGIVPVLAKTIEQYADLYRLVQRFKKYKNETEELLECLETQKCIFVHETKLLLIPTVGSRNAQAMVQDQDHPLWKDRETIERLDTVLGVMRDEISKASKRVHRKMNDFQKEIVSTEAGEASINSADVSQLKVRLRRRFKHTFSEDKLGKLADAIRKATEDFRILRTQVHEISMSRSCTPTYIGDRFSEHIERVKMTGSAARRIYEALARACTIHIQHQAHLSLKPAYGSEVGQGIKFKMGFHKAQQAHGTADHETLWFIVKTFSSKPASTLSETRASPKQTSPDHSFMAALQESSSSLNVKKVKFKLPESGSSSAPVITNHIKTTIVSTPAMPDLALHQNFCTHLRACCDSVGVRNELYVGFLEDSENWKMPVYSIGAPSTAEGPNEEITNTLSNLIAPSNKAASSARRISVVQQLQFAKLLAQATLDFHATPWMQSPWSSRNIIIYNLLLSNRTLGRHDSEPDLFVDVPVRSSAFADPSEMATFDPPFIQNAILFNLGVVLLELASEQLIQQMRREADHIPGSPPEMADCIAAFRQVKENQVYLGPKYSEIIRKCLHCDFGHGWDLRNPSLQEAVYREVVSELERLESGLRGLGRFGE